MTYARPVRLAALAAAVTLGCAALAAAPAAAVTGPAVAAADTTYAYTAQITVGDHDHDRGCSGVLVDREWLLTAASCFAADPATSLSVPAGKPAVKTTAVIGRSDLTGTAGAAREIVQLVPRTDRDAVLARLNRPVTNVSPIALATTAPHRRGIPHARRVRPHRPDEAIGTTASAGAISTFSLLGTPGANDRWIEAGDGDGIPGTPGTNHKLGSSLHYTGTSLYAGLPYGPSTYGTLYALPLSNVTAGGAVAAVTTYQPGAGGLPAADVSFGYAAR
jgi:hypothetical protein